MTDLCHPLVGCPETSLHAYWSLIGNLDAHLQQTNGEIGVGLCCNPQPEVLMNIFCLDQILLHLWTHDWLLTPCVDMQNCNVHAVPVDSYRHSEATETQLQDGGLMLDRPSVNRLLLSIHQIEWSPLSGSSDPDGCSAAAPTGLPLWQLPCTCGQ